MHTLNIGGSKPPPYGVGLCFGFVGEDSILPLKLDAFLFGRLIAYPYNVVISFGGNGWSRSTILVTILLCFVLFVYPYTIFVIYIQYLCKTSLGKSAKYLTLCV